jgi:hypothetical protein
MAKNGRNADGTFAPGHKFSSKYKEEYCDLLIKYFNEQIAAGITPTFAGFASNVLFVDEDTIQEWGKVHPQFRTCMRVCKGKQKDFIVKGGLDGTLNQHLSKFMLSACHGLKETTDTNVNLDGKNDINVNISVVDKVSKG